MSVDARLEVVATLHRGDATRIAREREHDADALYVLSGDGTYNEVVNGVTSDVPLGFLPGGGTSVLPRALGLGRDPVAAARIAAAGECRPIGLGRVNGRRFTFNAGIGFGLTPSTDRLIVKMILGYRFNWAGGERK